MLAAVRALLVALCGVGLAYLWYSGYWWIAVVVAVPACLVGLALDRLGRSFLPEKPVLAAYFLEWWILSPAVTAAVAAAIVIVVTVALSVPDTATTETKKLIGGLSTGITTFLTAAFISWFGDEKNSTLADHIRDAFRAKYKRVPEPNTNREEGVYYFKKDSPGERWVYSDEFSGIEGWGRSARLARAHGIAGELKSRKSDPP